MKYLTQKFGPLPGYAWLLLGVGLFLAYRVWKGQSSTATANTATGTGFLSPDAQTGVVSALQAAIAGLAQNQRPGATGTTPAVTPPAATTTWSTRGIKQKLGEWASLIPTRATPYGTVTGAVPVGQPVTTTGSAVTGPKNFGSHGSALWYQLTNGSWISAWDLKASTPVASSANNPAASPITAATPPNLMNPVSPQAVTGA